MNATDLLIGVYLGLLKLFPRAFQAEYSDELEFVIRQTVEEATQHGRRPLVWLAWRELRDLPLAVLRAHIKERRQRIMVSGTPGYRLEDPVVGWNLLIMFAPFLMAIAILLLNLAEGFVHLSDFDVLILLVGLLAVLMYLVIIAGFAKGLPSWSIPSAGLMVCIAGYRIFTGWIDATPPQFHLSSVSEEVTFTAITGLLFYGHMLLLSALLVLAAAWVRPLRPFYKRVRGDWSLLSFLLYSCALVALLLGFGRYQGSEPYQLAGLLILAVGAWVYLRLSRSEARLGTLLVAVTIAIALVGMGKYMLYPQQIWVVHNTFPRWWEALVPLIDGGILLLVIAVPAVLKMFPVDYEEAGGGPA
jgi:hypothetical protein